MYELSPEKIRKIRTTLRRTQVRFAKLLGTTSTTVYRWEAGYNMPTPKMLEKLEKLEKYTSKFKDGEG